MDARAITATRIFCLLLAGATALLTVEPGPGSPPEPCPRPLGLQAGGRIHLRCAGSGGLPAPLAALARDCPLAAHGMGLPRAGDLVVRRGRCRLARRRLPVPLRLAAGDRIDLRRASVEELAALPGIGPAIARRIVARRARRGDIARPEDLLRVSGIGPATVRALRNLVVDPASPRR